MRNRFSFLFSFFLTFTAATPLFAGGAWVPEPGHGDVQLGFSRKTANTSWDAHGDHLEHSGRFQNHDFRYTYLSGEIGLRPGWSTTFLVTWLDGREGPTGDLHHNEGWSDAWFGLKYGWGGSQRPMAVRLEVRTPVFYDISGPYTLELHDSQGNFIGNSPEWRGILKHDVTGYWLQSWSLGGGDGWVNLEGGYTWRQGAPADQVPVNVDAGWTLPWGGLIVKGSLVYRQSLGNDSPRQPDDRFGSRDSYSFNNASMARAGVCLMRHFGKNDQWYAEVGYNQWFWGRSARKYKEPFVAVSRRF
jgi:hypothetical protein